MQTSYENQERVFKALCDKKRLQILDILKGGEKCACELLEDLEIGQSSLSYHMKILVDSNIVQSRQEGKWTHYMISERGRDEAVVLLKEITSTDFKTRNVCCCNGICK